MAKKPKIKLKTKQQPANPEPEELEDEDVMQGDEEEAVIGDEEEEEEIVEEEDEEDDDEDDGLVSVVVNGAEHRVTPEVAALLRKNDDALAARNNDQSAPKKKTQAELDKELSVLMFTDPEKAMRLIREGVVDQVRSEYQADQGIRQFWDMFYNNHKEFDRENDHKYIQVILNSNWELLKMMRPDLAAKKLAELSQREILRLTKRSKSSDGGNGQDLTVTERGGGGSARKGKKPVAEPPKPKTLFSLLNSRKEAKRSNIAKVAKR